MDADANKNSRADEDLTLSNPDTALIPSLVTGDPFTLGEGADSKKRTVTSTPNGTFNWLNTVATLDDGVTNTNGVTARFMYPAPTETFSAAIEIQPFSDRAMITLDETTDGNIMTNGLIIDLDVTMGDLLDTIQESNTEQWNMTFNGYNLLNYDLRSLDVSGLTINVVDFTNRTALNPDTSIPVPLTSTGLQGLERILDSSILYDDAIPAGNNIGIQYIWDSTEISEGTYPIVTDFFSFGFEDDGNQAHERVSNQIIRLELEEDADNTGRFVGSLEYTMVNQLNILEEGTYTGLTTISDEPSFIVIEDLTDEDAVRVNYLDKGRDGVSTQIADQEEAPSHSGVVTLDSNSYKVADTVTVTLSDPDLNVDSDLVDIFTVVRTPNTDPAFDAIGKAGLPTEDSDGTPFSFGPLGRLLDITFNDQTWTPGNCGTDTEGLSNTGFTLIENGTESGIFTGDFQIPAQYCDRNTNPHSKASVTGTDIEVNYVDFRDASGEIIEVCLLYTSPSPRD